MEEVIQSNQQLDIDQIPEIAAQTFTPLAPAYAKINLTIHLIITFLPPLVALVLLFLPFISLTGDNKTAISYLSLGWIVLMSMFSIYRFKANRIKGYAVRELDISLKTGLFFQRIVSQPVLRIQHVEIERGPLERKYGLATLQVFSAGGALYTFQIPGLPVKTAESIRQFLLSHKDTQHHG
ncbi:PH domain-containing protein [Thalassotalea fusca]